ncbi:hypothetical protein GCM10010423_34130 [Streptomyces levis]|uniref:Uncharacterized protein n=1 Tax=Streptomyces levis TaxID=285566 RepID=A0ABN3NXC8_9ACTN
MTVTGTWHPEGALGVDAAWPPVVDAASVRPVPQPGNSSEQRAETCREVPEVLRSAGAGSPWGGARPGFRPMPHG